MIKILFAFNPKAESVSLNVMNLQAGFCCTRYGHDLHKRSVQNREAKPDQWAAMTFTPRRARRLPSP